MYLIRDRIYDNRWVTVEGVLIKFEHSLAQVPDKCITFFASNKDFMVLEQKSVDQAANESATIEEKPVGKKKKQ